MVLPTEPGELYDDDLALFLHHLYHGELSENPRYYNNINQLVMNQDPPFPHPHPQDLHPDQLVQLPPAGGVRGEHLDHRPLLYSLQVKINNGPVIRFPKWHQ